MHALSAWAASLPAMLALGVLVWVLATAKRNAAIVDVFWSLFFLLGATAQALTAQPESLRATLVLVLVAIWALRLSAFLAWRNWGEPEDRRYVAIRARNQPGFAWKSLFLVFLLQAVLAWLVGAPLAAAIASHAPLGLLDALGALLLLGGLGCETLADLQLARFRRDPASHGRVLDRGLWRYSRHPNYFGECCVWWGFYLIACAGGGAWTVFAPALMTLLLLRVSGVTLLEKDIAERRPAYREYVARTNAFFPGPRRPV